MRAYLRTRMRLLLWSAIAFVCLAINNFFVLGDMFCFPMSLCSHSAMRRRERRFAF